MQDKSTWYGSPILAVGHVVFWCAYLAFEHTAHLIYGDNHWSGSLLSSMFMMLATGVLAVCYIYLQHKPGKLGYAALLLSGLALFTLWNGLNAVLHGQITTEQLMAGGWLVWYSGGAYRFLLLLSWIGLFISGYIYLQKQTQKRQLLTAQHLAREAQLQLLMAQLNPHFLFNVLNSLDVAILEGNNAAAHQMVVKLSQFLRITLEHKFAGKIALQQELELIQRFVDIERQRSTQRLLVNYHVDADAASAYVPPLILQPLIENAIKFSRTLGGSEAHISVTTGIAEQQLNISITNLYNPEQKAVVAGTSSGLENVIHRLHLLYGERARLVTEDKAGSFAVSIALPLEVAL